MTRKWLSLGIALLLMVLPACAHLPGREPAAETPASPSEPPDAGFTYNELCQPGTWRTVVRCNEFISLRSAPSVDASVLSTIPLGKDVFFIAPAENGFAMVIDEQSGQLGYVLESYLSAGQADEIMKNTSFTGEQAKTLSAFLSRFTETGLRGLSLYQSEEKLVGDLSVLAQSLTARYGDALSVRPEQNGSEAVLSPEDVRTLLNGLVVWDIPPAKELFSLSWDTEQEPVPHGFAVPTGVRAVSGSLQDAIMPENESDASIASEAEDDVVGLIVDFAVFGDGVSWTEADTALTAEEAAKKYGPAIARGFAGVNLNDPEGIFGARVVFLYLASAEES